MRDLPSGAAGGSLGRDAAVDLSGAAGGFFRRLLRRGGRVASTQLGCAGDHGMGASFSLLLMRGATRERLLRSEAHLLDAFTRRRILRAPERAAISDTDFCMSMHLGVDARELVPPFPFAGRNSDGAFGTLLHGCVGDAFAGFLPWAVEHEPPEERSSSFAAELRAIKGSGVNDLLRVALAALIDPRGATAAQALADAGRALCRTAARPREAEAFFREQAVRGAGRRLVQIEQALDEHGRTPPWWARMLEGLADALRDGLNDPGLYLPAELVEAHGVEGAKGLFFGHAGEVGRLLTAWPALFAAARELRARGERMSVPL